MLVFACSFAMICLKISNFFLFLEKNYFLGFDEFESFGGVSGWFLT